MKTSSLAALRHSSFELHSSIEGVRAVQCQLSIASSASSAAMALMRAGTHVPACWSASLRCGAQCHQHASAANIQAWRRHAWTLQRGDVAAHGRQHGCGRHRGHCGRAAAPAAQRSDEIQFAAAAKVATFHGLSGDDFRYGSERVGLSTPAVRHVQLVGKGLDCWRQYMWPSIGPSEHAHAVPCCRGWSRSNSRH